MLDGLLLHLKETQSAARLALLRHLVFSTLQGPNQIVFTHGDLQPKNIMLHRVTNSDGSTSLDLKLIDWETSGWYPEYWEFCNAAFSARIRPDWLDTIRRIMPFYGKEFLMMEMIRNLLLC